MDKKAKDLTDRELIAALRCCATNDPCDDCPLFGPLGFGCIDETKLEAAARLERRAERDEKA